AFRRIEAFLDRVRARGELKTDEVPDDFAAAMDDDLSVPQALAVVHDHVRQGNSAAAQGDWTAAVARASAVRAMMAVLGLDPSAPQWATSAVGGADTGLRHATDALVRQLLDERRQARIDKDYQTADAIR